MDMIELPLIVAAGGLVGVGALALTMGAALSSLAELSAILPARGWSDGGEVGRGDATPRRGKSTRRRWAGWRPRYRGTATRS